MKADNEYLEELKHAYILMKGKGIELSFQNLRKFKEEHPEEKIPHPESIRQRFGKWSTALELIDVVPRKPGEEIEVDYLVTSLKEACKEVGQRKLHLNTSTYAKLRKEKKFNFLPSTSAFFNKFGTWIEAIKFAGLENEVKAQYHKMIENLLKEAHAETKKRGLRFSRNTYNELRKDKKFKHFPCIEVCVKEYGTWNNALTKAGLKTFEKKQYTDKELIEKLKEAQDILGEKFSSSTFVDLPGFPYPPTYKKRFGSWKAALKELEMSYVNDNTKNK